MVIALRWRGPSPSSASRSWKARSSSSATESSITRPSSASGMKRSTSSRPSCRAPHQTDPDLARRVSSCRQGPVGLRPLLHVQALPSAFFSRRASLEKNPEAARGMTSDVSAIDRVPSLLPPHRPPSSGASPDPAKGEALRLPHAQSELVATWSSRADAPGRWTESASCLASSARERRLR
jgi:hypothetical protein